MTDLSNIQSTIYVQYSSVIKNMSIFLNSQMSVYV